VASPLHVCCLPLGMGLREEEQSVVIAALYHVLRGVSSVS
jgi:hypothetical protein